MSAIDSITMSAIFRQLPCWVRRVAAQPHPYGVSIRAYFVVPGSYGASCGLYGLRPSRIFGARFGKSISVLIVRVLLSAESCQRDLTCTREGPHRGFVTVIDSRTRCSSFNCPLHLLAARGRTTQKSRAVIRCAARGRWFPPRASSGIRETAFFRPSRKRKSCENTRAARFFHSRGVPAPNSFRKTRL